MTERLIIRNFAGLEEIDIELGRITVLIGPQASGKSVCAKCLYWLKSFLPEILNAARSQDDKRTFDNAFVNNFKEYFPGAWVNEKNLFIRYEINDLFIQLENIKGKLKISYSDLFKEVAKINRQESQEASRAGSRSTSYMWESSRIIEANDALRYEVDNAIDIEQTYIPAARSFFSSLKGGALAFMANSPVFDPFLRQYITTYELTRRYFLNNKLDQSKYLIALVYQVIKGQIEIKAHDDFIITEDGRRIPLGSASSGQQESFAMLLILLSIAFEEHHGGELRAVYIEEPEAHLFPESQRIIAQLLSIISNTRSESLQTIVTTHSPYFLSSFNNLIYAHQLAERLQDQPKELKKLYKIVPKSQQIPLSDFRVYGLENGKAVSLIDHELGLISASLLDSASDVTAEQFGDLMALDSTTQA